MASSTETTHEGTVSQQADRIRELVRKMAVWKGQTTSVTNFIALQRLRPLEEVVVRNRIDKFEALFANFDSLMDELEGLDPEGLYYNPVERSNIESNYYMTLAEAERLLTGQPEQPTSGASPALSVNAPTSNSRRRIKLPESKLPTFGGDHTLWLSFKTEFDSMVGNQTDLSDTDKLHYLRSALSGDAFCKVQMLAITEENYHKTWEMLEVTYSDKRVIASRHLHRLIHLPKQEREEAQGLERLVDHTRQHLESLKSMKATLEDMVVALLEDKLHPSTADAWDERQERGEFPKLEDLLQFLSRRATRLINRAKDKPPSAGRTESAKSKQKLGRSAVYANVATTRPTCKHCEESPHPLYRCSKFLKLGVPLRWKAVQEIKACPKCLQTGHAVGNCKYQDCKTCGEPHNSLLHAHSSNQATHEDQQVTN